MTNIEAMIEFNNGYCFIDPKTVHDFTTDQQITLDTEALNTLLPMIAQNMPTHVHINQAEINTDNDSFIKFFEALLAINSIEFLRVDFEGSNRASHFVLLAQTAAKLRELSLATLECAKIPQNNPDITIAFSYLRFHHRDLVLQGSYASTPYPTQFNADHDFPPIDIMRRIQFTRSQHRPHLDANPSRRMGFR